MCKDEKMVNNEDGKKMMSYKDIGIYLNILKKNAVISVDARWEIADRKRRLREIMEPVDEARELPDKMKEYNKEYQAIFRSLGISMGNQIKVASGKEKELEAKLLELMGRYKDVLEDEEARKEEVEKLLKREVEIDVDPISYKWCGDKLDSNDIDELMRLEMVYKDEDDDDDSDRRRRNKRKRDRKK